jgi:hypothetical protein
LSTLSKTNQHRCRTLAVAVVLGALLMGCDQEERPTTPVARIDDRVLTLEDIHARFDSVRAPSDAQVYEYIQRWIVNELLYREAVRQGFDRSEELSVQLQDIRRQLTITAMLEQSIYQQDDLYSTREEVEQYFIRRTPWNEACQRIAADPRRAGTMVAAMDSVFHTQATLVPDNLWRAVTGTPVGTPSFPIRTDDGFFVLMTWKLGRRGDTPDVLYVEPEIKGRLAIERRQQRMDELLENLRREHAVEILVGPALSDTAGVERTY